MTETERKLLDKAALAAFSALMTRDSAMLVKNRAVLAWQAAEEFVKARKENSINRYNRILEEYQGIEALRRILELNGNTGRCLESLVNRYADKSDPLAAYSGENFAGGKNTGQFAIIRYLKKQADKSA